MKKFIENFTKFDKFVFKLLIIIFIGAVIMGLTSCSSKKKTVETTKTTLSTKKYIDSTAIKLNIIASENKQSTTSNETKKEELIEYDGELGDTLKITKKGPAGKIISQTIITGKGKAKLKTSTKKVSNTSNSSIDSTSITSNKIALKKETTKKEASATKSKNKKTNTLAFSTYIWLTLLLVCIVAFWYLNKKFSFISKIKNAIKHIIKFFK
jgi:hypothetical protein